MGNSYPVFFSSMVAFLLSSPSIYSWQQGIDAVGGWSTILSCGTSLMIACAGFMKQLFVRKEITYDVILDTGINSKNGIFRFIMIEIINTGNENIAKEDFVHPIEIDLKGRDVSLHSHPEILQEDGVIIPTELFSQFFTLVASDKIKLGTFLFQKKEKFSVKCVVKDGIGVGAITVNARINSGKVRRRVKLFYRNIKAVFFASLLFFTVMSPTYMILRWFVYDVASREFIFLLSATLVFAIVSIWMLIRR